MPAHKRYSAAAVRRAKKRAERADLAQKIGALKDKELKAKTEAARLKYVSERKALEYRHYTLRQRRAKR